MKLREASSKRNIKLNNYFTRQEMVLKNSIVKVLRSYSQAQYNKIIYYFTLLDTSLPYHIAMRANVVLAMMAFLRTLGIVQPSFVSKNILKIYFNFLANPNLPMQDRNVLEDLIEIAKGQNRKFSAKQFHDYFENYLNKFKSIREPKDIPIDKPRKSSSVPGTKEDLEEISQEQKIAGKDVPTILWGIPFALIIFTIFIGYKIYQRKRVRGK